MRGFFIALSRDAMRNILPQRDWRHPAFLLAALFGAYAIWPSLSTIVADYQQTQWQGQFGYEAGNELEREAALKDFGRELVRVERQRFNRGDSVIVKAEVRRANQLGGM